MRSKKEGFSVRQKRSVEYKNSQVSIFIILGLVILISTSVFFFFKSRSAVFNPEDITEIHSTPITSYVDECVKYAAYKAITILGRQGGYIYFPEFIEYDPRSYISELPFSKVSRVPYWYYRGTMRYPSFEKMESDLAKYVKEKAEICVDGFNSFSDQYNVTILEDMVVTVKIAEKNVQFNTLYPVDIVKKSNNQKIELRDYTSSINVRLKEAYDMAKEFVEYDLEQGFLENLTLHAIMTHPDVPLDGIDLTLKPKVWGLTNIKEDLYGFMRYLLSAKVRLTFDDPLRPFSKEKEVYEDLYALDEGQALAGDFEGMDIPKDMYDYKHFYFEVFDEEDYSGLQNSIQMGHDDYFLVTASPNKNGKLYSYRKSLEQGLSFPVSAIFQFWHFLYDVYYPVTFTVYDPEAMSERGADNKGFVFKIAYPVHLQKNRPAQRELISFNTFEYTPTKDPCDFEDDIYKTKTIYTRNAHHVNYWSGELDPIKNVEIFYECPSSVCYLGNTTCSANTCRIDIPLPNSCYNRIIIGMKDGFITNKIQAITSLENYDLDLVPLKEFNYTVLAFTDYGAEDKDNNGVLDISDNEYDLSKYNENYTIFVRLESYETGYVAEAIYDPSSEFNALNLSGGKYMFDSFLILGKDTVAGGYHGNVTITYPTAEDFSDTYDMTDSSSVEFKIFVKVPKPRDENDEDFVELQNVFDDNKYDYLTQLKPVFS